MAKLVFDIETVGEDFDELDKTTQKVLTRWIEREISTEDEKKNLMHDLKEGMGFSPLTGQIVAIGVLDLEKDKGVVYYQSSHKKQKDEEIEEDNFKFKVCTEKEMLESFWEGAKQYNEFISFNGRGFDVPFMVARSAILGIRPSKDLMSNRYLNSQPSGAKHVDLQDQLTFYGAMRRRGGLHLWCRAFGIKSPKEDGVSGDDVNGLFHDKKFLEIAKYNRGDLYATRDLYERWNQFMRFSW